MKGRGACQTCGSGGFNPNLPGSFYLVTDGQIVKGGISNSSGNRLYQHFLQGLNEVLHVVDFESGRDAAAVENLWMQYIAARRHFAVGKHRLPDGYTEAIHIHNGLNKFIETLVGLGSPKIVWL